LGATNFYALIQATGVIEYHILACWVPSQFLYGPRAGSLCNC
jgi:hypothetical protein